MRARRARRDRRLRPRGTPPCRRAPRDRPRGRARRARRPPRSPRPAAGPGRAPSAPSEDGRGQRMLAPPLHRRRQVQHLVGGEARRGHDRRPATAGRGSACPVLSKTTASIPAASSSASPPRIRMPASAPLPVPTMIAVGVARPMAHGQAMTTTVMNATRAWVSRGSGPRTNQSPKVAARHAQHDRHEDAADPVGQPLDRRLGALRPADQLHDLGQGGVAADPRRPEQEGPVAVHGRRR